MDQKRIRVGGEVGGGGVGVGVVVIVVVVVVIVIVIVRRHTASLISYNEYYN